MRCSCPPDSVLVVTPWLEGGGAQKSLSGLMAKAGSVHFHVVTLFSGCAEFDAVRSLSNCFTQLEEPRTPVGAIRASYKLRGLLAHHTKVYSLMRGSHVVLGLRRTASFSKKSMAGTIHQLPSSEDNGFSSKLEELALKRFTKNAELVTAPSERAIKEAKQRGYNTADRLVFVPNITQPSTAPTTPPRSSRLSVVRLVFAGRLTQQKGLDLLPSLLKDVQVPIHLRILGDGPERRQLSEIYSGLPSQVQVEFVGYTSDVLSHVDWSDAAFMPSRSELNPVFIHEVWSRGRPVLASDIPAFIDLESQGPLYRAKDSREYAHLISRLVSPDDIRKTAYGYSVVDSAETTTLETFFRNK